MSVINLGRTTRTNIAYYQTDGMGRDGYITYNNGGFWKDKQISPRNPIYRKKLSIFRSLLHQPAPFQYYSDGSGRDSYVIENNGGLVKPFEPMAKQNLAKFLRKGDDFTNFSRKVFFTKTQRKILNKLKKIQDGVISRLYNDSLEKIKKNNLDFRTNSLNDFFRFSKRRIRPQTGQNKTKTIPKNLTMSINYANSQQNESGNLSINKDMPMNLKTNSYNRSNILDKFYRNRNVNNKENKKMKILKNLKINSSGLKCELINNDMSTKNCNNTYRDNVYHSLSPNYSTNKHILFSCRNNLTKQKKKTDNLFPNSKTFGSFSASHRVNNLANAKYNYNLKKRSNLIKKYLLNNARCVFSEGNKTNN